MKLKRQRPERILQSATADQIIPEQPQRLLDPRQAITEELWQRFVVNTPSVSVSLKSELLTLFPDRAKELNNDEQEWEEAQGRLERARTSDLIEYFDLVRRVIHVFPDRRKEILSDEIAYQEALDYIGDFASKVKYVGNVIELAAYLCVVYPERRDQLQIGDEQWDAVKQSPYLTSVEDLTHLCIPRLEYAAILFPEKRDEIRSKLSGFELGDNKESIQISSDFSVYVSMIYSLAVIFAEELQFTNHGLELVNRDSFAKGESLPDRSMV